VNGFGAVFVDRDLAFMSPLRLFDANGRQLAVVHAPFRRTPDECTFAGVVFNGSVVGRSAGTEPPSVRGSRPAVNLGVRDGNRPPLAAGAQPPRCAR